MGDLLRLAREFQDKVKAEAAEAAEREDTGKGYNPYLAVLTKDEFAAPVRYEGQEEEVAEEAHAVEEEDEEPDISASRPLTEDEAGELRELLKPHLRLNNVSCAFQAEADADDFLNFAVDLVTDQEPLGSILDQLAELELEICDMDAMDGIEATLEDFLMGLDGAKKNWREERAAREAAPKPQSLEEELLNSASHVKIDLSAKKYSKDARQQEMDSLIGKRGSLKSRMGMYDASGKIVKHTEREGFASDEGAKEASTDQLRRAELTAVMNDRSLSKDDKARKMEEIRAKYPDQGSRSTSKIAADEGLDASIESRGAPSTGDVDLSSKSVSDRRKQEMAKMFGGGKRSSLKNRMGMYDETGKIIKGASGEDEEEDEGPKEKSLDQLRREEMMAVMKDKSLSKDEKAKKMEEVKLKYDGGASPAATNGSAPAAMSSYGGLDASGRSTKSEESVQAHKPLTAEETESLSADLKSHLRLNNVSCAFQAEADAEDFLNYAIDLVNDGEPLPKILEDLADMELEICDADALTNIEDTLENFLVLRNGGKKNWREEKAAREAAAANKSQSLEAELMSGNGHQGMDFSAKTAANKAKNEMEALFGGGKRGSLKNRMGMYDESGKIIKQNAHDDEEEDEGPKAKSTDQLRREEMMMIMKDRSLSKDEKARKMEEVKIKYDGGPSPAAGTTNGAPANGANARMSPTAKAGGLDVSARSEEAGPKALTDDEARSLSDILRPHLKLNNASWVDADKMAENVYDCAVNSINEGEPVGKIVANLAEMKLTICDDESLENIGQTLEKFLKKSTQKKWREEQAKREAAANRPLSLEEELLQSESHIKIDLSAKKYSREGRQQEMASLIGKRGSLKSRSMYDESGKIVKSNSIEEDAGNDGPKEKTADQLRRDELMAIMKDRSLSKDEKAKKMEEIKQKYDGGAPPQAEAAMSAASRGAPAMAASSGAAPLDVSTKSEESVQAHKPLSEEETESLTSLLRSHLKLNNVACALDAEADAEDLLNYTVDLINEGEPLDTIAENLADMELEICDVGALENIRDALEDFLVQRNGGKKNWKEERAAREEAARKQRQSLEMELLNSDSHVKVDLSAKKYATRYSQERDALFGGGGAGGGLQSRMGMYDETGKLVKNSKQEARDVDKGPKASSTDQLRREEMMLIMKDRSLSKDEKARRMDEVKLKYDGGESTTESTSVGSSLTSGSGNSARGRGRGVDLSAKAASEKHAREMAGLFGKGEGNAMSKNRTSYEQNLQHDRVAQKLGRGEAVEHKPAAARSSKPGNGAPPTLDAQRRAELQSIMKDGSLSKDERREKMDEVKAKYAAMAPTSSVSSSTSSSAGRRRADPSANTYSATPAKELDAIACKTTSVRDRQSKFNSQSAIAKGRDQRTGRDTTSDQKTRRAEGFYSSRRNKTANKVDTTAFAFAENHLYGVYKQKKKQTSHEYGGRF
ncbi:hypothetical protein ACHAXT_001618 [Thalassiosira profunda]